MRGKYKSIIVLKNSFVIYSFALLYNLAQISGFR